MNFRPCLIVLFLNSLHELEKGFDQEGNQGLIICSAGWKGWDSQAGAGQALLFISPLSGPRPKFYFPAVLSFSPLPAPSLSHCRNMCTTSQDRPNCEDHLCLAHFPVCSLVPFTVIWEIGLLSLDSTSSDACDVKQSPSYASGSWFLRTHQRSIVNWFHKNVLKVVVMGAFQYIPQLCIFWIVPCFL